MEGINEYLLSVTAAAVICSCITALVGKNVGGQKLIRILCGIFVAVTVLKPITQLRFSMPESIQDLIPVHADRYIEEGLQSAKSAQTQRIMQQTESYILEKAVSLNCDLKVQVELSEVSPYEPIRVEMTGAVSPMAKLQLSKWMEQSLNIPAEEQIWNG